MKTIPLLVGIAVLAALLAGCSGSGVPVSQASGATIRTTASDHLSFIALIVGWLKTMYYIVPEGASYVTEIEETIPDPDEPGEFLYHLKGTNSDGSSFEYWQDQEDASGRATIAWPGMSCAVEYGPYAEVGGIGQQDNTEEWSTGLRMVTHWQADWNEWPPISLFIGQATIHGGAPMQYRLERRAGDDSLRLTLPDGTVVTFATPVTDTVPGTTCWPVVSAGATATFEGPNGTLTYQLTGATNDWWDHIAFTSDAGFSGSFSVDANLVGSGQLSQDGEIVGALSWNGDLHGTLSLVGAGVEDVSASAMALQFRLDQWVHNQARLGAAPMY